jgi:hypothetical protein
MIKFIIKFNKIKINYGIDDEKFAWNASLAFLINLKLKFFALNLINLINFLKTIIIKNIQS